MIYTDLYIFVSDNPEGGFKELHDFAKSVGYDKGWHYNHLGTPYYLCRKKIVVLRALAKMRAPVVSKKTVREILKHTKARIATTTDYKSFSIRKMSAHLLIDICASNGIEIDIGHILIQSDHAYCKTKYEFEDTKIVFTINKKYPTGHVLMNDQTELTIPPSVICTIQENTKPMPRSRIRIKIKNKS